jgi:orotidine-5'-phosphate decarboxylase
MEFVKKLNKKWDEGKFVCIGLDPVLEKIPKVTKGNFFEFNKAIIDKTHDVVLAYKPNSAFYEAKGAEGIEELKKTCDYLSKNYSDIPIILDAKRGDIGSTNEGYVAFAFDYLRVDAITIHPYLGKEAVKPFLDRKDKGIIILCKTSNPGSGEFQDLKIDGKTLYEIVAQKVITEWNENGNICFVVGGTYPEEFKTVRKIVGNVPILIPGIGAQGGDLEKTVRNGKDDNNQGMIISSSRGIIFASSGNDFAEAARNEALKLSNEIKKYL